MPGLGLAVTLAPDHRGASIKAWVKLLSYLSLSGLSLDETPETMTGVCRGA